MSEDSRTLWIGNLDEKVTEELIYELFLQRDVTVDDGQMRCLGLYHDGPGSTVHCYDAKWPIDKLIFPTEGEGTHKKHKGHAYIVFHHPESVQYASQVLDGSTLFGHPLSMKARSLPITYKTSTPPTASNNYSSQGNKGRFDNSSLRTGFNKATTWHGNDFAPRGRSNFRGRPGGGGGSSDYGQNSGYNQGFNNFNNQGNSNFWMGGGQGSNDTTASYTTNMSMEEKRQKLMQQQNLTLEAHRQIQQGVMNMASQMYGMGQQQQQQQQSQQQQQQQQGMWNNNSYNNAGNWNMGSGGSGGGNSSGYQSYNTEQYSTWYQQ